MHVGNHGIRVYKGHAGLKPAGTYGFSVWGVGVGFGVEVYAV